MMELLVIALAAALSAGGTFAGMKLGERWGLVQVPGGRRQHPRPVSRLGGVGLYLGFAGTSLALYLWAPRPADPNLHLPLLGLLAGTTLAALGGLADDRWELPAGLQFTIQALAALGAIAADIFIGEATLPFVGKVNVPELIAYPLTGFWIMGMMNTVNWLDGLDGLAAGVGAIAALFFGLHSILKLDQPVVGWYSLALAGACLGFLAFNFYPARVFLGSLGAQTLGFALAALSIIAPARVMTALLVLLIPIADVAFLIVDRWRQGRSPWQGDRGHLHFRLADLGYSQRQIVLAYWLLCGLYGAAALLIDSRELKLAAFVGIAAVVAAGWWTLRRRRP